MSSNSIAAAQSAVQYALANVQSAQSAVLNANTFDGVTRATQDLNKATAELSKANAALAAAEKASKVMSSSALGLGGAAGASASSYTNSQIRANMIGNAATGAAFGLGSLNTLNTALDAASLGLYTGSSSNSGMKSAAQKYSDNVWAEKQNAQKPQSKPSTSQSSSGTSRATQQQNNRMQMMNQYQYNQSQYFQTQQYSNNNAGPTQNTSYDSDSDDDQYHNGSAGVAQ